MFVFLCVPFDSLFRLYLRIRGITCGIVALDILTDVTDLNRQNTSISIVLIVPLLFRWTLNGTSSSPARSTRPSACGTWPLVSLWGANSKSLLESHFETNGSLRFRGVHKNCRDYSSTVSFTVFQYSQSWFSWMSLWSNLGSSSGQATLIQYSNGQSSRKLVLHSLISGLCIANLVGHTSLTSGMQLRGDILVSCNADSYIRVSEWALFGRTLIRTSAKVDVYCSTITGRNCVRWM